MNTSKFLSSTCISAGLVALAGIVFLLGLVGEPASMTYAGLIPRETEQVSSPQAAVITVCTSGCDYDTIQGAVDAAYVGDIIKVAAGTYAGVSVRSGTAQAVYLDKSLTIQGGYTLTDWSTAYPITQPTTFDAQDKGRVFYITGAISPTLAGLRITGGNAAGSGGTMDPGGSPYDVGGGVHILTATVTLSNNVILSNTAATGGGLYMYGGRLTLCGNIISANTANLYDGAGLYMENSAADLNGNIISANLANGGHGGGLYVSASSISFVGNTLSGNIARYSGGGAYLLNSDATVSGNHVFTNTAGGYGGGLYIGWGLATFNANTLLANTAEGRGGGLYLDYGDNADLAGNTILLNTANGGAGTDGGGGIWIESSHNITLSANVTLSNTASLNCGGLSLNSSSATLDDNITAANMSGGDGGGLCILASTVAMSTDSISGNTAAGLGGGLYVDESSFTLSRSTVLSNTASDSGGGLYLYRSDATLINSVFAQNQASGTGSGLYVRYSSPRIVHTTVADNYGGDGSGLSITGEENEESYFPSTAVLTNVILVSHTVGITITGGNTATVNSVLWYATPLTVSTASMATFAIHDEFVGDPAFAPDGFHVRSSSAAINRGVEAGITDDIDGERRPFGNGYDLGADEWADWRFVYLPVVLRQVSAQN